LRCISKKAISYALACFDALEALSVSQPEDVDLALILARASAEKGCLDEANAYYARVLELAPERTDIKGELRMIYHNKGMVKEEIEAIRALLEADHSNVELLSDLQELQIKAGNDREAINTLIKLNQIAPSTKWLNKLGKVYTNLGFINEAANFFIDFANFY